MAFEVVYADPPWQFEQRRTGGSWSSGASQKYATLRLPELMALPVARVLAPEAVLFLWVPSRLKFSHGPVVAAAWGCPNYQATVYWAKPRWGLGYWFRNAVEELLVFTRGRVRPFRCQRRNLVSAPTGGHSEKPAVFRALVEAATGPAAPTRNLELFGTRAVPGWTVLGEAVTGRDIREDLAALAPDGAREESWGMEPPLSGPMRPGTS